LTETITIITSRYTASNNILLRKKYLVVSLDLFALPKQQKSSFAHYTIFVDPPQFLWTPLALGLLLTKLDVKTGFVEKMRNPRCRKMSFLTAGFLSSLGAYKTF
jgi:hypothetical protein